eukprot:TRINITY_DN1040_c0_g1_i2.p1 TRINITY_DN1040_c0_g1~~TRINITY_DN1040_c0_g1_i2.p1  ORF type:complete len:151 (-),score=15.29 TRINITY_DN1040_c0_g1_i2:137-589(-)
MDYTTKYVDVYMFPCPTCSKSAVTQVNEMVDYVTTNGLGVGMYWLDIEGTSYWSSSTTTNQNFFQGLVGQLKALGKSFGVYTNKNQWQPIMGSTYNGGSAYQLWWAYWSDTSSGCLTSGWSSFNGWTKANMQQWSGDKSLCGMSVDQSCY